MTRWTAGGLPSAVRQCPFFLKRLQLIATTWLIAGCAAAIEPLVTAQWLKDQVRRADLVVVDIRYGRGFGTAHFAASHIPGAVFKSYSDSWREERDGLAGMVPATDDVEALIRSLGVYNNDTVVIVSNGHSSSDFGAASRPASYFTGRRTSWSTRVAGTIPGLINLPEETLVDKDGDTAYFITAERLQ